MKPSDTFTCIHYACTMPARDCVLRQRARYAGHGTWRSVAGRVPVRLEYCASGKCEQGALIKLQLAGQEIERPRDVNYKAQWAAKRRAAAAKSILPQPQPRAAPPKNPKTSDLARQAGVCRKVVARALAGKAIRSASDRKLRPILERLGLAHTMAPMLEVTHLHSVKEAPVRTCEWTEEPCETSLRKGNETGLCLRHGRVRWKREHRGGLHGKPWKWVRPSASVRVAV